MNYNLTTKKRFDTFGEKKQRQFRYSDITHTKLKKFNERVVEYMKKQYGYSVTADLIMDTALAYLDHEVIADHIIATKDLKEDS